jgi:hypothetical protein
MYHLKADQEAFTGTKAEPGPGATVPVVFGVDSIMGKLCQETQEKIAKAGFADRSFPKEALVINNYLKTVPQMIARWPFTIVLVNHLKFGKDDMGNTVGHTAGGASISFQEGFEFQMEMRKQKLKAVDWEGKQLRINCVKNSFGPHPRSIETRMRWREEEDPDRPGCWIQRTVWDWDWALIHLLGVHLTEGHRAATLKANDVHVRVTKASDVDNMAWSASLGMKEADAMPWSELGAAIRADAALVKRIRTALAINTRPLLAGDYSSQIEELAKKVVV